MTHAAPLARLATAFAAGVVVGSLGAPLWFAPLVGIVGGVAPKSTWKGPGGRALWLAVLAGWIGASVGSDGCATVEGRPGDVRGHFLATPVEGSAPFVEADGCGPFTVVIPRDLASPAAGRPVVVVGTWVEGRHRTWFRASSLNPTESTGGARLTLARLSVRWRDGLVARLPRLYGERAPLVAALVFARREGLDDDVRNGFAVTGIAHLLAISGFHVGVIAGLVVALLRAVGWSRRRAALGAALGAWVYVAFIGFPDAACRAALILAFVALARARGRPPARWAALGGAGLLLLVLDPGRASSAGFQLSFAGAAGLIAWAGALGRALQASARGRLPTGLITALSAGVAATLATLPIVAWHFERVSVVGIPMTLLASPLVSLALPGAILTIALDLVSPGVASFLAGGVDGLLQVLLRLTAPVAGHAGVSVSVARRPSRWLETLRSVDAVVGA